MFDLVSCESRTVAGEETSIAIVYTDGNGEEQNITGTLCVSCGVSDLDCGFIYTNHFVVDEGDESEQAIADLLYQSGFAVDCVSLPD